MREIIVLAFFVLFVSGCSTMEGLGKDVQKLGDKIEEAASDATN